LIEKLKQIADSIKDDANETKRKLEIEEIIKQYAEGKLKYHELMTRVINMTTDGK
jgi:hypothetical protein